MSFFFFFYDLGDRLESISPILNYKLRDDIIFKGKRIPYDRFTCFREKGGKYVPYYMSDKSDGIVIDLFPLINIGVAEFLGTLNDKYTDILTSAFRYYFEKMHLPFFDILGVLFDKVAEKEPWVKASFASHSLRVTKKESNREDIKFIANSLNFLKLCDSKAYADFLLQFCRAFYYRYIDIENASLNYYSLLQVLGLSHHFGKRPKYAYKKIGYNSIFKDVKKHYISDGTSAGVAALSLFMSGLFKNLGYYDYKDCIKTELLNDDYYELCEKRLVSSLGDDKCGKYFRTGICSFSFKAPKLTSEFEKAYAAEESFYCLQSLESLHSLRQRTQGYLHTGIDAVCAGDKLIYRFDYENKLIAEKIYGISDFADLCSLCYFTIESTVGKISYFVESLDRHDKDIHDSCVKEISKEFNSEAKRLKDELLSCKRESSAFKDKLSACQLDLESAQAEIVQLRSQLESKSVIIQDLSEELKETSSIVACTYEDTIDEVVDVKEAISIENMVSSLSGLKLCVLGGYSSMEEKLTELGIDFVTVHNVNELRQHSYNADFFCICSRFVGHTIIQRARSDFASQNDCFFYFNGTNAQALVRGYYDFAMKYLGC